MVAKKSTAKPSTKPAVLEDDVETAEVETEAELSTKQIINEGIGRVIEATGIDVQKNRYKAMRAIAFTAFSNAIAEGTFGDLVDQAISEIEALPAGWEIERAPKADEPVKATKSTKVAATATATKSAKPTAAKGAATSGRARPKR